MLLIVYYVGFMIAGDLSDYLIGLIVEREFSSISGSGDRPPNKKIISALKLRRVVVFERVD